MGYLVRRVPYKGLGWKIQYETWKGGRKARDIPRQEWRQLGFHEAMSLEEAKARALQLNTLERVAERERKRNAIVLRLREEAEVQSAFIPAHDRSEFESKYLPAEETDKRWSHWRAAVKVLCEAKLPPEEWYDLKNRLYDLFSRHKMSTSYVQKIIPWLNRWGHFQARKHRTPFLPLPAPRGRAREAIADKYFEKHEEGLASGPIVPSALDSAKARLRPELWNWLYLTVWLGLRPIEVDSLRSPKARQVSTQEGVTVLSVYQSKLTSKPKAERWKHIPLVETEQEKALELVLAGSFKRPLVKTVKAVFGVRVTLYGGRKGFTDLMLERGHPLEAISAWLGHTSIERTWRSYKNRKKVLLGKAG